MFFIPLLASSQCETWVGKNIETDAKNFHSIYRQALKSSDFEIAFENWQKVYKMAPAADGKRDAHYTDGAEIYKSLLAKASSEEDKAMYKRKIIELYDAAIACYEAGAITTKNNTPEETKKKIGYLYGRKAYDMFYFINAPYEDNIVALDKCIEYAGDDAEYTILDVYPRIVVWQYKQKIMSKEKAVEIFNKMNQIAEYNISNNEKYADGYQQAQAAMESVFAEIESEIFDCEYFKQKLLPEYYENKDDAEILRKVYLKLQQQGCSETDEDMVELSLAWKEYAKTENQRLQKEFEANNPAAAARIAYDEGRYKDAIDKYRQAVAQETSNEKKATYLFGIASIEFRKLNLYSQARSTAYEAARLNPNWGRPYMLIGDMYGKTARSCGDAWNQRLAILAAIDKYAYAKSIDASLASEANQRIGSYSNSLPDGAEAHMRGVKEGQTETVGCWIGESVRLRFK